MYRGRSITRTVRIGDKEVIVDSQLEERVLRHLDANGFQDRWHKPPIGINRGDSNYTPDVELSVEHEGMTHRAIVEIKPAKSFLTAYIKRRMIGIAKHYPTNLLLLYTDKEKKWYRIDITTGKVNEFGLPQPGNIPINRLYKPLSLRATRVYNHHYKRAAVPVIANRLLDITITFLKAPFVAPKKQRRKYRRRK